MKSEQEPMSYFCLPFLEEVSGAFSTQVAPSPSLDSESGIPVPNNNDPPSSSSDQLPGIRGVIRPATAPAAGSRSRVSGSGSARNMLGELTQFVPWCRPATAVPRGSAARVPNTFGLGDLSLDMVTSSATHLLDRERVCV